jgi:hypothetical protein
MTETATVIDLKAIQERYSEAWRTHNPDAIAALHTEDTRFCTHGAGETAEGRAAMRASAAETFERFPDFRSEAHRLLFGPDHWVLEWGMISGDLRVDCVDIVVLNEDGLVKTKDTYFDFAQLQAALSSLGSD